MHSIQYKIRAAHRVGIKNQSKLKSRQHSVSARTKTPRVPRSNSRISKNEIYLSKLSDWNVVWSNIKKVINNETDIRYYRFS